MSVLGCVWGAHRSLVEVDGDEAPTYEWCEREWLTRLRGTAPAPAAVPNWLRMELWSAWRREQAEGRVSEPHQLTMWELVR